jgi:hypothetical protein
MSTEVKEFNPPLDTPEQLENRLEWIREINRTHPDGVDDDALLSVVCDRAHEELRIEWSTDDKLCVESFEVVHQTACGCTKITRYTKEAQEDFNDLSLDLRSFVVFSLPLIEWMDGSDFCDATWEKEAEGREYITEDEWVDRNREAHGVITDTGDSSWSRNTLISALCTRAHEELDFIYLGRSDEYDVDVDDAISYTKEAQDIFDICYTRLEDKILEIGCLIEN